MSTTFKPHPEVEVSKAKAPTVAASTVWKKRCPDGPMQAFSDAQLLHDTGCLNGFVSAVAAAYNNHRPLELSPDDVWLVLAQGFAQHVAKDPEAYRDHLGIEFEGRQTLKIYRDEFVLNSPDNDWPGCFKEFTDMIGEAALPAYIALVPEFSTSTDLTRAAIAVTLMDTMQSYFRYEVYTMCGFPAITLTGTVDDWKDVRKRVEFFVGMEEFAGARPTPKYWLAGVRAILDQFVAAAAGNPDLEFWRSMYNLGGGSGGPYVSGWLVDLYPYTKDGYAVGQKLRPDQFPSGMASAPVKWFYYDNEVDLTFMAGHVGAEVLDNGTVRPYVGWGVSNA